ncbi:pRL2-23 [Streptomyces sp. BB1-1-1]|uniref:pRL2-23 n=1 Tax=Streptomyces sp. BB1-1-1 TaxID=3074430 RepID=UPI002877AD46|nr:pRL2-23 [Streptomyces sp. BB1-1-1]WND39860.1 pRL2-23 [Streptomyces sp. BB1-1-1]
MNGMWASVVAVAGTLLGVLATGLLQRWISVRAEREAGLQRLREAAIMLADALTDYRGRLYWETSLRSSAETTPEQEREARKESWASRSQVNYAMNRLRLSTRDDSLLELATAARDATFGVQTQTCTPHEAREQQHAFLRTVAALAPQSVQPISS